MTHGARFKDGRGGVDRLFGQNPADGGIPKREDPDRLRAENFLRQISADCFSIFGGNLIGTYAHGSLAFGCFRWDGGFGLYCRRARSRPGSAKGGVRPGAFIARIGRAAEGCETSVVLERHCKDFRSPTPYELRDSIAYRDGASRDPAGFSKRMHGTDPDLASHFTVLKSVGFTVPGAPVGAVSGDVPREAYVDGILADVGGAEEEAIGNPPY